MSLVIGANEMRDASRIEVDKIWGNALVSADTVIATEITEGAVVVAETATVDKISNGGVLICNELTSDPTTTTGNQYYGIDDNIQVLARAVSDRSRLDEFLTNVENRF